MNKLEARAIIENTGNYDEEEIEEVMDVYDALAKHMGWEDTRRDKRYIVKFHDIFWYMPSEWEEEHQEEMDNLFEAFCEDQIDNIKEDFYVCGIDVDRLLTRQTVGHYQAFIVDIPYINEDNIAELAMQFYDEYNYEGGQCAEEQIYVMRTLKSLENNYMDYWLMFLECQEDFPAKVLKEMREKYNKDKKGEK